MGKLNFSQVAAMNEHFVLQTLASFLDCAASCGILNIELWAGLPHCYAPDMTPEKADGIARQLRERGQRLICYTPEQCVYPYNIAAREADLREYSVAYFMQNLELACRLGAPMLQIVPGWGYRSETRDSALARSMDSIGRIAKRADELGIRVVLEALEDEESNLIRTAQELNSVLTTLDMPNLGAVVDTCPMAAAGEDFAQSRAVLGDRLWHTHFIDSQHRAWGDGDLPLETYLQQLDAMGYQGYLTLEVLNDQYLLSPEQALHQSAEAVRKRLG